MDKSIVLEFDYLRKEVVVANVKLYSDNKVEMERFTDNPMDNPLKMEVSKKEIAYLFTDRCFPASRGNCKEVLESLGLTEHDPFKIIPITHGIMWDDFYWIRFKGEQLIWNDVKIRD